MGNARAEFVTEKREQRGFVLAETQAFYRFNRPATGGFVTRSFVSRYFNPLNCVFCVLRYIENVHRKYRNETWKVLLYTFQVVVTLVSDK